MARHLKHVVELVLARGPTALLVARGFTKKRLHYSRLDGDIWKLVTFEVGRFTFGDPDTEFDGMACTVSLPLHALMVRKPFPKNPHNADPSTLVDFQLLDRSPSRGRWAVVGSDETAVAATGVSVCEALERYVLPYLDDIKTLDDVVRTSSTPEVKAAAHLLQGRRQEAIDELIGKRAMYQSGSPRDQVKFRREVEDYARELGLELPPDDFVPVSEHSQLLKKVADAWMLLGPPYTRYEHAEKLLAEAQKGGDVPADLREIVDTRREEIWPGLSTRYLCRLGESLCRRAGTATPAERNEMLRLARAAFGIVASRGPVPEQYQQAYEEARAAN